MTLEEAQACLAAGERRNRMKRDPALAIDIAEKAISERDQLRAVNDELLKVVVECADLLHFMTPREGYSPDGALAHARAAIAKAKE